MLIRTKIRRGVFIAFAAVLWARGSVRAESLDVFIQEALTNNAAIAAARKNWDAMKARVPQARAFADPMVGVDFERSDTTQFGTYSDAEWMIAQEVPWFGKRALRGRVEEGAARKAEQEYRATVLEVTALVKQAYFDLWQARGGLDINDSNQAVMRQFVGITTAKYEVGQSSQADVLKAQTTLSKLMEDRFDFAREFQRGVAELNALLGRAPNAAVEAEPGVPVPVFEVSLDSLQKAALANRPELLGVRDGDIASAKASLALAKKHYAPDFQFRVEARQYNGQSGFQEYDTGVFMNFPWINFKRYNSAIAEARSGLERSEDVYVAMQRETQAKVKKLYDGIQVMKHHYELFGEKIIPQQRAAVQAALASYESDRAEFLDLLDAQRMLFDFQMQNLHHAAEFQRLKAELTRVVGGELPREIPAEGK